MSITQVNTLELLEATITTIGFLRKWKDYGKKMFIPINNRYRRVCWRCSSMDIEHHSARFSHYDIAASPVIGATDGIRQANFCSASGNLSLLINIAACHSISYFPLVIFSYP